MLRFPWTKSRTERSTTDDATDLELGQFCPPTTPNRMTGVAPPSALVPRDELLWAFEQGADTEDEAIEMLRENDNN